MVKFIESELILLKKEIDEMWTLVYNQLDRCPPPPIQPPGHAMISIT